MHSLRGDKAEHFPLVLTPVFSPVLPLVSPLVLFAPREDNIEEREAVGVGVGFLGGGVGVGVGLCGCGYGRDEKGGDERGWC